MPAQRARARAHHLSRACDAGAAHSPATAVPQTRAHETSARAIAALEKALARPGQRQGCGRAGAARTAEEADEHGRAPRVREAHHHVGKALRGRDLARRPCGSERSDAQERCGMLAPSPASCAPVMASQRERALKMRSSRFKWACNGRRSISTKRASGCLSTRWWTPGWGRRGGGWAIGSDGRRTWPPPDRWTTPMRPLRPHEKRMILRGGMSRSG